jgi:hypothetical protein
MLGDLALRKAGGLMSLLTSSEPMSSTQHTSASSGRPMVTLLRRARLASGKKRNCSQLRAGPARDAAHEAWIVLQVPFDLGPAVCRLRAVGHLPAQLNS